MRRAVKIHRFDVFFGRSNNLLAVGQIKYDERSDKASVLKKLDQEARRAIKIHRLYRIFAFLNAVISKGIRFRFGPLGLS